MTDHLPKKPDHKRNPYYFEEKRMSDILLALARQTKVIFITPLIFCIITIIYVLFIAKPVYTSTSKIMSSSGSAGASQVSGLASQLGISLMNSQTEQQWAYQEIIKSRTLARTILKRKYDTEEFGPQKSLLQILTYGNDEIEFDMYALEIKAIDKLLKMIDVSKDIQTAIYTVKMHASEPQLAAAINKILIEELDAHQREYNKTKTSETRQFIEERIIDAEKELISAEEDLKNFMDRNRRIENSPALKLQEQRLAREVTVLTGVFTTLKQQNETTKIEEVKESDYVIILDPPEIPLEASKPNKLLMLVQALMFGIVCGIIIGFVRDYIEDSDDDEKDKIYQMKSMFLKNIYDLIPRRFKKIF